jgi:hypothetical protein
MADSDSTGTDENPTGTTDSIARSPEHTERQMVDAATSLNLGSMVGDVALSVDSYPTKRNGSVSLHIGDSEISGRFMVSPEKAEWLAEQLQEHAETARTE